MAQHSTVWQDERDHRLCIVPSGCPWEKGTKGEAIKREEQKEVERVREGGRGRATGRLRKGENLPRQCSTTRLPEFHKFYRGKASSSAGWEIVGDLAALKYFFFLLAGGQTNHQSLSTKTWRNKAYARRIARMLPMVARQIKAFG